LKILGLIVASILAAALLAVVVGGRMMLSFVSAPHSAAGVESKIVDVPTEVTSAALAERLATADLISNPDWLALYLDHLHTGPKPQPGEYALSPSLSPVEIIDRIGRGAVVTYTVTVSPGETAEQVFDELANQKLAPKGMLEASFRDASLIARLNIPSTTLEGYLFADTYTFSRGLSADALLERMVHKYQKSLPPKVLEDARTRGLTEADLVVVASLIELSGLMEMEWPEYSAIIHNRLRDGLPLEHEGSLAYGVDKPRDKLEAADYAQDTPYNTFRTPGLPPTPIATPGLAALAAAATPKGEGKFIAPRPSMKDGHIFCADEDCVKAAYLAAGVPIPPPRFARPKPSRSR